jgi:hypothetical protein
MWDSITVEPGTPKHYLIKDTKGFREHTEIENLKEMLSGKRVVVVCPSPSLEGLGEGELIDSYDVVVRINQKFKMSEEKEKDYGTKSDILIGSFNSKNITECNKNYDYIKSFKRVIGVMPSSRYAPKINFFKKMDKDGINCTLLDDRYIYKVFKDVGTVPNSGLMGIILLMNYDIKELYVTGLTFYNMGTFGNIYNSDYKESIKSVGQTVDRNSHDHKIHKQPPQIEYFKELYIQNKEIIKLDKYLTKNLFTK